MTDHARTMYDKAVQGSFRDSPIYVVAVSTVALVLLGLTVAPHVHLPVSPTPTPVYYTFGAPVGCTNGFAYTQGNGPGTTFNTREEAARAAAQYNKVVRPQKRKCRVTAMTLTQYSTNVRIAPIPGQGPYPPPGVRGHGFFR